MRFEGLAYRAHNPRWSWAPTSGEGARLHGGRFNAKGDRGALPLARHEHGDPGGHAGIRQPLPAAAAGRGTTVRGCRPLPAGGAPPPAGARRASRMRGGRAWRGGGGGRGGGWRSDFALRAPRASSCRALPSVPAPTEEPRPVALGRGAAARRARVRPRPPLPRDARSWREGASCAPPHRRPNSRSMSASCSST